MGSQVVKESNTYANIELIKDRSAKKIEPYIYGRRLSDTLEFPMEVYNAHGLFYPSYEAQAIQEWLFGRAEPHFLSLLEPDKANESLLCWLVDPQSVKVAGRLCGWTFNVVCAAPYAFTDIVEETFNCNEQASVLQYHNLSNVEDYLYPEMTVQMLGNSNYILIENQSDNNRVFQITNINAVNKIFVDNKRQFMTAGDGQDIFQNFNLNWFRFCIGTNKLYVNGRCTITFKNRFMKAVAGW
jgi:hypothetical protein